MKSRWTIGKRLTLAFLTLAAITLGLGLVGYFGARRSGRNMEEIVRDRMPSVTNLLVIKNGSSEVQAAQQRIGNPQTDVASRKVENERIAIVRQAYGEAWKAYEAIPKEGEEEALWGKLSTAWQNWREENNKFFQISAEYDKLNVTDPDELRASLEKFRGDHYNLVQRVLAMTHSKELIDGGDDAGQCAFGKWLTTVTTDNPDIQSGLQQLREPHKKFHEAVAKVKELVRKGDSQAALDVAFKDVLPGSQLVCKGFESLVQFVTNAQQLADRAQKQLQEKCVPAQLAANDVLDQLVAVAQKGAQDASQSAEAMGATIRIVSVTAMGIGLAAALLLGVVITRSINNALSKIASALDEGAHQVSAAAGQVSAASQSLAEGASEQASSLEETSSALEQMAAMTRTNAGNAKQANELAGSARKAADDGDKTMVQLNEAMGAINGSSEKISKIIKVIEEIAFQTNLLALNAAVEAARAGDHGKGFAVVADEVRNLAMRSAQAAKETTALIEDSVNRARGGTQVAGEVGKALGAIVGDVSKVSDLINGIAQASDEQAQGVEQVNTAVSQMDKVTQQNASGAEESAAAAEELAAQSAAVKGMVNELVSLVGGSARDRASESGRENRIAPDTRAGRKAAPVRKQTVKAQHAAVTKPSAEEFLSLEDAGLKDF
jgi:methyl-accepting chemotaxis protein